MDKSSSRRYYFPIMTSDRVQRQIDRLLDEAEEAIARYDWDAVRLAANAVLAIAPDNPDAITFPAAAERSLASSIPPTTIESTDPPPTTTPAATPDQPASFANGRYQVKRFLGEGGKKKVYLAHDTTLDREVAFALIKTEGLDETSRTRIQREAQAMGRLGSHAHIVTVFDLGEENGQPYMVTELMGGGDVEGVIEDAQDHRLPLEQAIKISQETCRGMEFAHGRGIVHRDLKPGNVWITTDGIAKIGDFGLAVALDRSRLTTEGMMIGTVSYMPPEQAMGGEVTPRSDLYSLGAMLYEMVTGRPPFLGDDSVAIIGQHINTPPVNPTWHNGQCPRPLEALIMRLLAKNPSERPDSAADVLSALDAIELDAGAESGEAAFETGVLDSLAGGVFVGRQREMGELKAYLEDTLSGRGRLVTLAGEPGIGKTRTAAELTTYAALRQAQVLWGRCYEGEGAPPYWPWVQAIRSYVRDVDPEQLRSEMGAGAADIAQVVSDVREQLPGLEALPQLEPEQARFRLFDSITTFLKNAGRRQPLVLVLDDLQWADHTSLLLLEFLAKEISNSRLLIIGTYRDMELSRQHPLSQTLGELTRERLFQRVLLRGLDQKDVGRFIELASGVNPPAGMVEVVHRQTEGNPLFVTEVVRLLVQEGELTQEKVGQRDSWSVRIPEGVREVIGKRLDRLLERCNETLTIASVIGREFTLEQLSALIEDISGDRLLDVMDEALSARVIEELPRSVGRYQFTHALIQETLVGEISANRKVRLHARIAEALESLYGEDSEAHAAELTSHFVQAEAILGTEKLVRYSLLAGERALATFAHEDALGHFQRALVAREGQPMDAEMAALLFGLGRAQDATLQMHQFQETIATLGRSFDYYAEAGDVAHAIAIAEHPVHLTPGVTGMVQIIARALELVIPESDDAGRLLYRYGEAIGVQGGDYEIAQEAFNQSIAIAQREGDLALEMRAQASAGQVAGYNLRWQESVDKGLRAIELSHLIDDHQAELRARFFTSAILSFMFDPEKARLHAEVALVLGEKMRDRAGLAQALWVNEIPSLYEGDWRRARSFSDRALAESPLDSRLVSNRVVLEYEVGDFSQGSAYLERLLEVKDLAAPGPNVEYGYPVMVIPTVGRITGLADRFDVAKAAAETILSSPSATPILVLYARLGLALIAVQQGDAAGATEQYATLDSQRGIRVPSFMASGRLLGLLAMTIGNLDQATEHFEMAIALCQSAGYRPELAWTCCDYADTLLQRDGEGDRAKATSLLDESLAISSELGMRPLMERVLSRREILKA